MVTARKETAIQLERDGTRLRLDGILQPSVFPRIAGAADHRRPHDLALLAVRRDQIEEECRLFSDSTHRW